MPRLEATRSGPQDHTAPHCFLETCHQDSPSISAIAAGAARSSPSWGGTRRTRRRRPDGVRDCESEIAQSEIAPGALFIGFTKNQLHTHTRCTKTSRCTALLIQHGVATLGEQEHGSYSHLGCIFKRQLVKLGGRSCISEPAGVLEAVRTTRQHLHRHMLPTPGPA